MFDFLLEFVGVVFNKDILFHFFFTLKRVSPLGTFWNEGPDPQVLWYADPWAPLAASDGGSLHFVRRRLVATALTINQSFISQITAQMYSWMDEFLKKWLSFTSVPWTGASMMSTSLVGEMNDVPIPRWRPALWALCKPLLEMKFN